MKKTIARLTAAFLALALLFGPSPFVSTAQAADLSKSTISVNGTGTVKVNPDIATANVGYETTAKTVKEVQEKSAEVMNKVVEALIALGIREKDIQTTSYYMYEQYDYNRYYADPIKYPEPELIGYTLSHMLSVTIRDIDKVGEIIEAATDAGANRTNGINFSLDNQEELYLEALALATANAAKKAEAIAGALSVELGDPENLIETSYGQVYPYYADSYGLTANYSMNRAESAAGVSMQTGKVEVTASVTIVYGFTKK